MEVDAVHARRKGVMKTRNFGLLFPIGLVIKTMNRVQRTLRLAGAINVGATRGIIANMT